MGVGNIFTTAFKTIFKMTLDNSKKEMGVGNIFVFVISFQKNT